MQIATKAQGQTEYTVDFPANVMADVLVVGGGGSGGGVGTNGHKGGGGGAGGLVYIKDFSIINGSYSISVGKGGDIGENDSFRKNGDGKNGYNSEFSKLNDTNYTILAYGGGGGPGHGSGSALMGGSGGGVATNLWQKYNISVDGEGFYIWKWIYRRPISSE